MSEKEILKRMSLKEKIAYCSGADFWHTKRVPSCNVESIMMADGPHGLRKQEDSADMLGINESVKATSFPTASILACSFDTDLVSQVGSAIAVEAKENEVSVVLGPGVNIKRNPLCGRNFEYYSEDPYLSGKLGAAFVNGANKQGIGCSVKHFALNNQEYKRFVSDSLADERTMREIYLMPFETVVKEAGPDMVMCAYNKLNGTYCSDNKWLLTDVLRNEWGFDGVVVTDWGALNDRMEGFKAGCDLCMPGGAAYMEAEALEAVENGLVSEEDVDASVSRILNLVQKRKIVAEGLDKDSLLNKHYELAKQVATESAVLLKNDENILPLSKEEVAFIGYMAKEPRYQGSGSSHINPWKVTNIKDLYPNVAFAPGYDVYGQTTETMISEAVELAKAVKIPVIFAGLPDDYESEGFEREHMRMPEGHLKLIEEVSKVNSNVVVVLFAGGAVEVPFIEAVKAILYMGLPGEAGIEAALELLFGNANPSGKLAETWPLKYEDCVCSDYYGQKDAEYREGIYVGYRYYLSANVPVRFPFGFGLSYTKFDYSDLQISGNQVTLKVTNSGAVEGKEIIQLYIEPLLENAYRPKRELKAFQKITLKAGESKNIAFTLCDRDFSIWKDGWVIPKGQYKICISKNCEDIELSEVIEKNGVAVNYDGLPNWYINLSDSPSQQDFETLLGRKIETKSAKKGSYTMQNTIMEMKDDSFVMKLLFAVIETMMAKKFGGKKDYKNTSFKMMVIMAADCSLNGMKINSGMKNYLIEGLLEMANGHFFKGIRKMMKRVK